MIDDIGVRIMGHLGFRALESVVFFGMITPVHFHLEFWESPTHVSQSVKHIYMRTSQQTAQAAPLLSCYRLSTNARPGKNMSTPQQIKTAAHFRLSGL